MIRLLQKLGLGEWSEIVPGPLHALFLVLVGWFVALVLRRTVDRVVKFTEAHRGDAEEKRRLETLARVAKYGVSVVIYGMVTVAVLAELGITIAPLLATAGVAGVAIGFGAQSLVKDYFTGVVLLLENQIRVGDSVVVADLEGIVEEVTLRYVRLRDYEGSVHYVPNGEIKTVTNRARSYINAVVDVAISPDADVNAGLVALREAGEAVKADPTFADRVLGDVEVAGVDKLTETAVVLRARLKVVPLQQAAVRRELLRRTKERLDAAGVDLPKSTMTLMGAGADAVAPAAGGVAPRNA